MSGDDISEGTVLHIYMKGRALAMDLRTEGGLERLRDTAWQDLRPDQHLAFQLFEHARKLLSNEPTTPAPDLSGNN